MLVHLHLTRTLALLSVALTPALVAPTAAVAQDRPVVIYAQPEDARSERVTFASLDLTTLGDQKRLHFRVAGAVERICERDLGRDGLQDPGYFLCERNAWSGAEPQIADAITRAQQIAMTGSSTIAAAAITVSAL
jgi:UrcA family protein